MPYFFSLILNLNANLTPQKIFFGTVSRKSGPKPYNSDALFRGVLRKHESKKAAEFCVYAIRC